MKFPREMWAGSHIKGAINPSRKVVENKEEYEQFVKAYNGKMSVYTSVYDYNDFTHNRGLEHSIILDRIFLDFDAHDGNLDEAYDALVKVHNWLVSEDLKHSMAFSGRGFYIFVYGEVADNIRQIRAFFDICVDVAQSTTLDASVINTARLRRVLNTWNMVGARYCIPINTNDITQGIDWILQASSGPCLQQPEYYGDKLVQWPEVKEFHAIPIEIDSVESPGELPILPCLKNAVMVENPNHRARVLLVQWYNEILSEMAVLETGSFASPRKVGGPALRTIKTSICKEVSTIADNENVWIDYNEQETHKHVSFIVDKRYMAPSCNTLINEGLCVGKCWRYGQ